MNQKYKEYFIFSRGERNGIYALLFLIVLLLLAINLNQFLVVHKNYDFSAIQKTSDSIYAAIAAADTLKKYEKNKFQKYGYKQFSEKNSKVKYFYFDPNKIDKAQWEQLGLKSWQAEMIEKYKRKGGIFKIKKDLGKMYTIKKETYQALEPYILLPDSIPGKTNWNDHKYGAFSKHDKSISSEKININTVDSVTLLHVKRIGPYLTSKILQYRNKLGGFVNIEQLKEIETGPLVNIDIFATADIEAKYNFDSENITKININTATAEILRSHPYMNLPVANSIILNRIKIGKYTSLEQIKHLKYMTDQLFSKMQPYLSLE